jgi:hypothetical protein
MGLNGRRALGAADLVAFCVNREAIARSIGSKNCSLKTITASLIGFLAEAQEGVPEACIRISLLPSSSPLPSVFAVKGLPILYRWALEKVPP